MGLRSVLIRSGALGDTLLALPALRALGCGAAALGSAAGLLRGRLEGVDVTRLGDARLSPLWAGRPDVGALSILGRPERAYLLGHVGELEMGLRAAGVEIVTLQTEPPPGVHQAIHYLSLAGGAAATGPEEIEPPLAPLPEDRRAAAAWRARSGIPDDAILLLPGSGGAQKCWPGFAALGLQLQREGRSAAIVLGPVELERGASASDYPGLPTLEGPELSATAGLLAEAPLSIGNDAGTSHLAAAIGGRTLTLFGPTEPARWRPIGPRAQILRAGDWSELRPPRVLRSALALLNELEAG